MLNTETILIPAMTFIAGITLGYFAKYKLSKNTETSRDMSEELTRIQKEYAEYQDSVNRHMINLSQQTRKVAKYCQEIHEQVAISSTRLASQEISNQILQNHGSYFFPNHLRESSSSQKARVEPPRDYAPKVPGGILSEEYGLRDSGQNLEIADQNVGSNDENSTHKPSKPAYGFKSAV